MFFLTLSWRILISNKLEQLEFKLDKIIGIIGIKEKLENFIVNVWFFATISHEILYLPLTS